MRFDPRLAEIRFGYGHNPDLNPPADAGEIIARLGARDRAAQRWPIDLYATRTPLLVEYQRLNKLRKSGDMEGVTLNKALRKRVRRDQMMYLNTALSRAALSEGAFRERLTRFWGDHLTVRGKQALTKQLVSTYIEEAIRPHLAGRFADLLKSAVTHPMMLLYLDQFRSIGPGSNGAKNGNRGLNENLAREVLELHTLGVDGAYAQDDVRQLAELFTGLSVKSDRTFVFRDNIAEPGSETVLGESYGGRKANLNDIHEVLEDLAVHPDTARHLAWKLAVHFVADVPEQALVDHVARAYLRSGGDLTATYSALLEHPAAWTVQLGKARQPFDFIAASLRALAVSPRTMSEHDDKDVLRRYYKPMRAMGQNWEFPGGPDGLPEEASYWITPPALAVRINWALRAPEDILAKLPDPRALLERALGPMANDALNFAVAGAENRSVGVALVLTSPQFQRR